MWITRLFSPPAKKGAVTGLPVRGRLIRNFIFGKRGAVAVEFAMIAPIFLLLVFGIVDFGHAWYMKMEITNASREGARLGTRYVSATSTPSTLSPSISDVVTAKYAPLLPSDADLKVSLDGPGAVCTLWISNIDLTVKVEAIKTWFVVNKFIPGMNSSTKLSSSTVMRLE